MTKAGLIRYKRADRITERKVGNTLLIVPFKKAPGTGLRGIVLKNVTAQFIWKKCENGADVEDIVEAVISEFNVDREKADCEIQKLLKELLRLELIICINDKKKKGVS